MEAPVSAPNRKFDQFEVTRESVFYIQVCSPIPPEEKEKLNIIVSQNYPPGTSCGRGEVSDNEEYAPVRCAENPNNWHYIMFC